MTVAERDQAEALADELNRELFGWPRLLNAEEIIDLVWRYALKDF